MLHGGSGKRCMPSSVYFPFYEDPADTTKFGVGVLDNDGVVRKMAGSGTRVLTLPIQGAGRVRLRYPIMPIHGEGSSVWKELSVVKKKLQDVELANALSHYLIELRATRVSGLHSHEFYLSLDQWDRVQNGSIVSASTTLANGHSHNLEVWVNPNKQRFEYKLCDGREYCWDQHDKKLRVKESPSDLGELDGN